MKNPSALKSAPFWILLVISLGAAAYGVQAATARIAAMEAGLTDGTATTAQVYGGQSWVVFESVIAGAGILGVLLALAVWALGSFRAAPTALAAPAHGAPLTETPLLAEPEPAWRDAPTKTDPATQAELVEPAASPEPTEASEEPTTAEAEPEGPRRAEAADAPGLTR